MDTVEKCMMIIAKAGEAKTLALEAIHKAREKQFEEAGKLLEESEKALTESHNAHSDLLFYDAEHEDLKVTIFMVHAADHLASADTVRILAEEIIKLREEG